MYTRTILEGSGYQFIKNSYSSNNGAPGFGRNKKRKRTPEDMERQNQSNRARHVQLLILGNFKEGWHVTLTYAKEKRPKDGEEAKKIVAKFHRRMKAKFKKAGFEYKWIAVTEIGGKGAVHHHLILEDIHTDSFTTQKAVKECWEFQAYYSSLYEEGSYESLSEYMAKKETKEDIPGCKISHSRNLEMPQKKKKRMRSKTWMLEPKIPKGWMLVKDSLYNGVNPFTGLPQQHYLIVETKPPNRRNTDGRII